MRPMLTAVLLLAAAGTAAQAAPGPSPASRVPGLMLTPATALPPAPASAARRDGCTHLLRAPASATARAVAARGWAVTGEAPVGGYRAVSFVGRLEQGTSGSCLLTLGNVALFRGPTLVALAWTKAGARRTVATIAPHGPNSARLWDGDVLSQPVADLTADARGALAIAPLPARDPVCGGTAQLPNLYGLPIARATPLLARHGWTPVPRTREAAAADCSGTGFGFCRIAYSGPAGTLAVTTVGDGDRPVSGYSVRCRSPARKRR